MFISISKASISAGAIKSLTGRIIWSNDVELDIAYNKSVSVVCLVSINRVDTEVNRWQSVR